MFENLTYMGKEYRHLVRHKDSAVIPAKQHNGPEGLVIRVPSDSLSKGVTEAMFYIRICLTGQVKLPDRHILASPLYLIEVDENITFVKDLQVSISHCVAQEDQSKLRLVTAMTKDLHDGMYTLGIEKATQLKCLAPGVATFTRRHFCLTGLVVPDDGKLTS